MRIIGCEHIHLKEIGSTNDYATELVAKTNPKAGTAISTAFQTKGKGQYGRKWTSVPDENIAVSIILRHIQLKPMQQAYLNMAMAIGVCDLISEATSMNAKIKWPNDIYLDNKKVCGLLIHNTLAGQVIKTSIIGIGINVNQQEFDSDIPNASSLSLITGRSFDVMALLDNLFLKLDVTYYHIVNNNLTLVIKAYQDKLWRNKEQITLVTDDSRNLGNYRLEGVDEFGRILVSNNKDGLCKFSLGEARILV